MIVIDYIKKIKDNIKILYIMIKKKKHIYFVYL